MERRVGVAYTPLEFRDTLHKLAEGEVDATPLVTGTVGLPGVDRAFDALAHPGTHAKIMIDPKSQATEPAGVVGWGGTSRHRRDRSGRHARD